MSLGLKLRKQILLALGAGLPELPVPTKPFPDLPGHVAHVRPRHPSKLRPDGYVCQMSTPPVRSVGVHRVRRVQLMHGRREVPAGRLTLGVPVFGHQAHRMYPEAELVHRLLAAFQQTGPILIVSKDRSTFVTPVSDMVKCPGPLYA